MDEARCLTRVCLEQYDISTGYVLAFRELNSSEIVEAGRLISRDLLGRAHEVFSLEERQWTKIDALVDLIHLHSKNAAFRIRTITLPRDLPYLNHTNRELALMRAGRKPFSVFSGWEMSEVEASIFSRLFDPMVEAGIFVRQEYQFSRGGRLVEGSRSEKNFVLLYALREESWRIPAYRMLRDSAAHIGWNDDYERLYGTLLGYNDEENDAWLRCRLEKGLQWGCATLYVPISTHEGSLTIDKLREGIFSDSRDSIDIYISEEGIGPIVDRLETPKQDARALVRLHMPYRHLQSFYALSQNLGDQFGPFRVERGNIDKLTSIIEANTEIVPLTQKS